MKNILQLLGFTQENCSFIWKHIKKQFRLFFSKQYSKPFIIICFGLVMAGAIYAGSVVSDLKQDVDVRIAQKKIELDNIFDFEESLRKNQVKTEGLTALEKLRAERAAQRAISGYKPVRPYLADDTYRELTRIEKISPLQLFIENFSVGWWGVIALTAVFLINILITLIKLPTLPHNNLKHAKWLSVPFFVLLTLWILQSIWLSFAIGFILASALDRHSIKAKGLNRIVSILIIYSICFFFLLLVVTKIQYEGWFWGIEFLDRRAFYDFRGIIKY